MFPFGIASRGSFKRQTILTFVVGFFVLISAFSFYQVKSNTDHEYRDSEEVAIGLAQALAVNSQSWVLTDDVVGLQEVVHSLLSYPEMRYAMILTPAGRVLAHSDTNRVGQFVTDGQSLALIKATPGNRVITDTTSIIDLAVPIWVGERHIGWARLAMGREAIARNLRMMILSSTLFVLFATALSLLAALLIANRFGSRIGRLVKVADAVQSGNFSERAHIPDAGDEINRLADSLNLMLDALARNEEQSRTSLLYTRSLIEASLDPLVTISLEGKITDVNKATEKVTGSSRVELAGTDFSDYFVDPGKARKGYQQVLQKGFVADYPLQIRHRDGHVTDVLYNASVYHDNAGKVLGIFAAARDVTALNKAEHERMQLSLQNRLILDSAGEGIYGLDINGVCTFINPAALKLLGFSAEELLAKRSHHMFHHTRPDGRPYPEEECPVQTAYRQGEVHRGIDLYWRKDGSSFSVEFISTPILEAGRTTGAVVMFSDITVRKQAEEELRRSEQGLSEAQRMAHLGNWELDLVSDELIWSDEIFRIFEIDKDKFAATYEAFLNAIHPEDRDRVNNAYTESLKNKKPYEIEHRLQMPDGRIKYVNEKCETYFGEDGKPLRSIGTVHDITERKLVEDELRRYKDHLEEEIQQRTADLVLARNAADTANLAKSVFLANMSHELRTPLNAILGFSSLMSKDPLLQPEQHENLNIINRSGEHLLVLINDVLEMSKIEAGRVELENSPFDLGGMVRDVSDMMHVRAKEKGLQLLVEQSSQVPRYIIGDEARLRQVLINLVGNAVKFTQQGGVTLRFGVKPDAEQQHLLIEVEDSGIGIKPEDQQRIFEPFVQLGEDATQKGTGLGLPLARQYAQLMGGKIEVDSMPGKGSVFRVELPLEVAEDAEVSRQKGKVQQDVTGLAPDQPEYRVMIVEDQRENQLLLERLMSNIGIQARVTENGAQAVELFKSWRPHLIWMDRRMPVMDGIEATRRIRELPGGKEVKIVAVTASAFTEQRDEMFKVGMDDFVRKPYRFNEIYECMGKQLGIKYVYAEQGGAEPASEAQLTAEMLAVLPVALLDELHAALESLESERISSAIRQVSAYDSALMKTLTQLAENFDYPAILKVLQNKTTGRGT
jgi:PAS domain S-box-containing protein